ncbi:uncharacterized protein [Diadema antillarum]|uniref:uncharacterized protein n=1 Tax=Diadema antillarum TaxID=105358 RepID=UPI003A8C7B8C
MPSREKGSVYDLQVCTVYGGPHYVTFDDWDYTFQGDCVHTLVTTDCANNGTTDQTFNVTARAEKDSVDNVTYTRELTVNVAGLVITLTTTDVLLDGLRVNIPFYRNNVYVTRSGEYTVVMTDIDLAVRWDGVSTAEVWLSEYYTGTVCGLCGDMDGAASNDMALPNGTQASTVEEFGDSWNDAALACPDTPTDVDPCASDLTRQAEAVAKCSAILNDTALFGACYASVPLDTYYESCVYSMCATDGDEDVFCNIIEVYATRCELQTDWRSNDTCPYVCPLNSAYSTCITECPPSCGDFGTISQCSDLDLGCTSGCACDDGFVYKDGQCVVDSQCGCTYDGLYFRSGEEYITEGCQERCVCDGISQLMSCENIQCSFNGVCDLRDGVRACFCQDSGEAICYNATVGYNITLIMASHSSLTLTWTVQQTVVFVIVQYRLQGIDTTWMNSSEVAGERELVILSGLESAASYEVRFVFVGEAFYSRSVINVYDTCVSDSQGVACETDYSTLSAYNFNLLYATSASLQLEWELPFVDIQFVRLQYRVDAGSPWDNGTNLEVTATSDTIQGLDEFTQYEVRVFIGQTNGDAAGSAVLLLLTCRGGTVGLNCAGDVPIDTGINTVSSDFVTVTWTVYVDVELVAVQYRALPSFQARTFVTADGWTESDPVPADRGLYNIDGLTPGRTYDYRLKLINGTQEDFGETNQVTLCPEGFQGANCEIDYSVVGAFNVRLLEATSSSLNITWKVDITILRAEVQYQLAPVNLSLPWDSSDTLQPTETDVLVESLAENTAYDVRVSVMRADGTVSYSDILRMKTCISGFEGLNCEIALAIDTTTSASTSAVDTTTVISTTQPTSVATDTTQMTTSVLTTSTPLATTPSSTSTPITTSMPTTTPIVSSTPSTPGPGTTRLTTSFSSTTATNPAQTTVGQAYQLEISHVNSLSITTRWTSPTGVTNVLLQYRLTGASEWNNGSMVPLERGHYVLAGLSAETEYELRVLFEGSQSLTPSNVVIASTCVRGFAGETSCDTDYMDVGAFDVVLDTATSASLAVTWSLQLDADWHMVQYRLLSTTEWFNSTELTATSRLYTVRSLDVNQSYVIRILTRRSTTAGRRKRADIAPNVGISAEIEALTCQTGQQGINCEEEVVSTPRVTTDELTTRTPVSTNTPWRYILIGLSVAFLFLIIVMVFLVVSIYQKYKRSRSNLARIDKVNAGRVRGYRNSDIMFAADSRSFSSSEIDQEAEEVDPSHVRISMVGDRNDRHDGGVRPLVQHERRRPVDERVQRYNAAYNHDY